jgi:hypothetical protein
MMQTLTNLFNKLVFRKESAVENKPEFVYTEEQLMARLKFFIGVCLALTLTGIVFVVLYSLIFVTQPLNAISPIDQKFFELIVPIATFLTGTLSGIMLAGAKKEDQEAMLQAQKLANENFEATKKAMVAPPPPPQPTVTVTDRGITIGAPMGGVTQAPGQVIVGYGGKMAPPPTIHPEI